MVPYPFIRNTKRQIGWPLLTMIFSLHENNWLLPVRLKCAMAYKYASQILRRRSGICAVAGAVWLFYSVLANAQTADTVYYNGKIITMWEQHPTVEAVGIQGDRFLA